MNDDAASNPVQQPILMLPTQAASLTEMVLVAEEISARGKYRPILILSRSMAVPDDLPEDIEIVKLYQADDAVLQIDPGSSSEETVSSDNEDKRSLFERFGLMPLYALYRFLRVRQMIRREMSRAEKIFEKYDPAAVLLADERRQGFYAGMLHAARRRGRLTLVVPYALSDLPDMVLPRKDKLGHYADRKPYRLIKKWIRWRHPCQVYESEVGPLLFYPAVETLVLASLGILSPKPWVIGGGWADIVGMIGEADRQRFVRRGAPAPKMVVTGQPSLDVLYATWQRKDALCQQLAADYGLDCDKKFIVFAVPQLGEHGITGWREHWAANTAITGTLAGTGANVLLSLHPKSAPEQYAFLEERFGVHILKESLSEALPAADIFVATYSSTVRWAVLLRIPSIVVDYGWFGYTFFDHFKGVIKVNDHAQLSPVLNQMLNDSEYYRRLKELQANASKEIMVFDGQAVRRIVDLVEERIER